MNPDKLNNAVGPQVRGARQRKNPWLAVLGVASLIGGLWAATQMFAYDVAYHEALGRHVGHLYAPWAILDWAAKWGGDYPDVIMRAASIGLLVATVGLLTMAITKVVLSNSSRANAYLHGSARWAQKADIIAAGLLPAEPTLIDRIAGQGDRIAALIKRKSGKDTLITGLFERIAAKAKVKAEKARAPAVYVGAWQDKRGNYFYLQHSGPEHVLTYAPTRSGKGVGLVVPTLLSWNASCVVLDLKGELWALTAGWRRGYANNKVLRFEPAATNCDVAWNPLDEIRADADHEVGDVQNLVAMIVDPDGKGLNSHWEKTAFALLTGVILYALHQAREKGTTATLPGIDAMLADPNRPITDLWKEMVGSSHEVVASAARDMIDRPEEEAGSVLSTAKSYLALYRDPVVAKNISSSSFRIKQLMNETDPVSLYIVTQPNDKARLRPLVRILVNAIVRLLADKMDFEGGRPVAHYKHRLLMMMDEFPSLGRLEIMQESLAFVAGYGIKCYIICQDINQLKSRETGYGHDEAITSNCHVQNAFPPNRVETAEHLSRLTGQTTVVKEQITTSGRRTAAMLGSVSRTWQEVQRPLLTADECLRMPGPKKNADGDIEEPGDMVIYVAGYPAIYGKQPLYFKDPVFQKRAAITAPAHSDRLPQQVQQP